MIIENINLYTLIERVISGKVNYAELKEFVHICTSIAAAYLRTQSYLGHLYLRVNSQDNKELDNLAVDSIAPLFARDQVGCFYLLQRFFQPQLDDMKRDGDLCLSQLRRLVTSRTKQEMMLYFRQQDPSGWRIFRNLQLTPKRNKRIGTFEDFHKTYYYHKPSEMGLSLPKDLKPSLPEIPFEELQGWFLKALQHTSKTPVVVENVLEKLVKDENYRWFVSRIKMFHCLKTVQGLRIEPILHEEIETLGFSEGSFGDDSDMELGENSVEIIKILSLFLREIATETYLNKRKVSRVELNVYLTICNDYFTDLINFGQPKKLPQYMDHRLGDESLKQNWSIHRNRLEYLIRLGKHELGKMLKEKVFRNGQVYT